MRTIVQLLDNYSPDSSIIIILWLQIQEVKMLEGQLEMLAEGTH